MSAQQRQMLKPLSTAYSCDVKEEGDEHGMKTTCT